MAANEELCGNCEENVAVVRCLDCDEVYCADCNLEYHKAAKFRTHRRSPLAPTTFPVKSTAPQADAPPDMSRMQSSASDIFNTSFNDDVLMCSNCEDEPATSKPNQEICNNFKIMPNMQYLPSLGCVCSFLRFAPFKIIMCNMLLVTTRTLHRLCGGLL